MAKRRRKRSRSSEEIKQNIDLVLKALHDSNEGLVLEVLMENPQVNTIADLVEQTNLTRYFAKKAADELVRRGLAERIKTPLGQGDKESSSYRYQPGERFPELRP